MKSQLLMLRRIARIAYILAVVCLITGIVLSMVNKPVIASTGGGDVSPTSQNGGDDPSLPEGEEEPTVEPNSPSLEKTKPPAPPKPLPTMEPGEELDPEIGRPVLKGATPTPMAVETQITDKNPGMNEFSRSQKVRQSSGASVSGDLLAQISQAAIEGEVSFTESDKSICQFGESWYDATAVVSLPEGVTVTLVTSWYVVHPSELNPGGPGDKHYATYQVQDGDSVTFAAWWPGVRAGDDVVEIHWGAALVYNGEVLDTASLDYYWYDWVCQRPTEVPTPVTPEATPTPDPGDEATPTPDPGDEATPTPDPGGEATPTPDSGGSTTPTATPVTGENLTLTPVPEGSIGTFSQDVGLATLPAPLAASDEVLLIPVTGADLTGWNLMPADISDWQTMFVNFGLIFLGIAFVLQGVVNNRIK